MSPASTLLRPTLVEQNYHSDGLGSSRSEAVTYYRAWPTKIYGSTYGFPEFLSV